MSTYNERRFELVVKITRIVSIIFNVILWIVLGISGLALLVVLFVSPEQLTFTLADFPEITERLDLLSISWQDVIGDSPVALKLPLLLLSGSTTVLTGIGIWVLRQIRGMLSDVIQKQPFSDANAKRLFQISYSVIGFSILSPLTFSVVAWSVIRQLEFATRDGFSFSLNFSLLFVAALLYILAHIFSYGAHLQEEVDGTV